MVSYFNGLEKKHIDKATKDINNLQDKINALKMQRELYELGIHINFKTKGRSISVICEENLYRTDAQKKDYTYWQKEVNYGRSRWSEVTLELDMLLSDVKAKQVFLKDSE